MVDTITVKFSSESLTSEELKATSDSKEACRAIMKYVRRQMVLWYQSQFASHESYLKAQWWIEVLAQLYRFLESSESPDSKPKSSSEIANSNTEDSINV